MDNFEKDKFIVEFINLSKDIQQKYIDYILSDNYYMNLSYSMKNLSKTLLSLYTKYLDNKILSTLTDKEVKILQKRFWTIPYEYNNKKIKDLDKIKNKDFENIIINHFTDDRVIRLFDEIISKEKIKNKKTTLIQAKQNFLLNNFSITNTFLITYLDSLTLKLIDKTSIHQHKSHLVIENLKDYYNENKSFFEKGYDTYLKICIASNFYDKLYCNVHDLKQPNNKLISRNLVSHGVKYSNSKIDCLRILNAVWFINTIIEETKMYDKFIIKKNNNIELKSK